jgi:elongation factor 1 alpha-like protein
MVVLGHVDAGKSTLMGQILVTSGQISKRDANKMGNLAHFLDENESERSRGVTMEIGTKTLRTASHDFVLLDAPGHADFVPVMITGAAAADVTVLVVAAVTGEFEAGWFGGGQTKEHIVLARGLGVSQVIVAVNKLDVEGWNEGRYNDIQSKVKEFLMQQDFKPKRIRFVPLSGLTGENVLEQTDPTLKQWYKGPTLLQAINDFQPANRQLEKALRFICNDVFPEGKGVVARGRVVQGFVQVGDKAVVLPVGDVVTVQKLEHLQPPSDADEKGRLSVGIAGETVDLVFDGRDLDISRLSTGSVLSYPDARPPLTKKCRVRIMVMDELAVPIIRGAQVLFHMHSLDVPCVMTNLISILNRDGTVKKERPRSLPPGCNAVVELTLSDRIVMEKYSDCRALGRFVLRRGGGTVAVGLIDETL